MEENNAFANRLWDNLSLREKHEMMRTAIKNGITNLNDIKEQYNEFAKGGSKNNSSSFYSRHRDRWLNFLLRKGVNPMQASRLSKYFSAQDALESGHGTSKAAREKNNFGGMQSHGKNITYGSIDDYMNAKWKMMNSRFSRALGARSMQEYANSINDPRYIGKGYLYCVYDGYKGKGKIDPAKQTKMMNDYTKLMMNIAGESGFKGRDIPEGSDLGFPQSAESIPLQENSNFTFMPLHPELFGITQPNWDSQSIERPTIEPIVSETVMQTYNPEEVERQERRQGMSMLEKVMRLTSIGNSDSPLGLLELFK